MLAAAPDTCSEKHRPEDALQNILPGGLKRWRRADGCREAADSLATRSETARQNHQVHAFPQLLKPARSAPRSSPLQDGPDHVGPSGKTRSALPRAVIDRPQLAVES